MMRILLLVLCAGISTPAMAQTGIPGSFPSVNPPGCTPQTPSACTTWTPAQWATALGLFATKVDTSGGVATNTTLIGALFGSPAILQSYVVSGLPACSGANKGAWADVTDALTPAWNTTVTGGSTTCVPVFCNGSTWTAH